MHRLLPLLALLPAATANLSKVLLTNPDATCTDGTQAGYYWKPATTNPRLWVVYLEGGGWCWDESSCGDRCGTPSNPNTDSSLCSSAKWGDEIAVDGLFWPTSPDLADVQGANKVYVRYCTSDGHMGNASAWGWNFRGGVVVEAVLQDLMDQHGLGQGGVEDTLLFGGGSAGARGAMVHLDYLPAMLGKAAAHVTLRGFLDSPLWIDMAPFPGVDFPGLPFTTQSVYKNFNVSHVDSMCAAANPDAVWKCLFGEYRMMFVQTPYLLVASQADAFQLGTNVGHKPSTSAEVQYALEFANRTRATVATIMAHYVPMNNVHAAVLSWSCYNHDIDCSTGFNTVFADTPAGNVTMSDAMAMFLSQDLAGGDTFEDSCTGFACGLGCNPMTFA